MGEMQNRLSVLEGAMTGFTALDARVGSLDSRTAMLESSFQTLAEGLRAKSGELEGLITGNKDALNADIQDLKPRLETIFGELGTKMKKLEGESTGRAGGGNGGKPILESKAIAGLGKLGSDKSEYRLWREKFENAMDQVRPGSKTLLLVWGNKVMSDGIPMKEEGGFDVEAVEDWSKEAADEDSDLDLDKWSLIRIGKDLMAVLTDKCEGEARDMVKNASREDSGIEAWMKLHDWFTRISGMAMSDRRNRVMSPNQSKREEDIIHDLERWKREVREVETADENDGGEGKLPYTYKLSALKKLLVGRIQEQVRFKEAELQVTVKERGEAKHKRIYEEIEREVHAYVRIAKLEKSRKEDAIPMDCDEIRDTPNSDWNNWARGKGQGVASITGWNWPAKEIQEVADYWSIDWMPIDDPWGWDVNALGKGKAAMKGWKGSSGAAGKGGGFQGACYNCGEVGHPAQECPKGKGKGLGKSTGFGKAQDKGKGKGVGGFAGFCYGFGGYGHSSKYCPSLGKGGGKGNADSPGVHAVSEGAQGKTQECDYVALGADCIGLDWVGIGGPPKPMTIGDKAIWNTMKRDRRGKLKIVQDNCQCAKDCCALEILEVGEGNWERIEITLDSGAAETVGPKGAVGNVRIRRDNGREGIMYRAANGNTMPNYGEQRLAWESEEDSKGGINIQVTDVTKVLASVGKICEAGNRVVFEPEGGYIERISDGNRTKFKKKGAVYVLETWVKARSQEDQIAAVESSDFSWQDVLP